MHRSCRHLPLLIHTIRPALAGIASAVLIGTLNLPGAQAAETANAPKHAAPATLKPSAMHGPVDDRIATAQSPQDHAILAADFEAAASDMDAQAARHERMGRAYDAMGQKSGNLSMGSHCRAIATNFRDAAKKTRELAKFHRLQGSAH